MSSDTNDSGGCQQSGAGGATPDSEWGAAQCLTPKEVFDYRFTLSWEHFKFHAEQRTKMFHFFLISAALILNAFSLMLRAADPVYSSYAFVPLVFGGLMSTFFLSLDVRNTQLLEYSENILRRLEETVLFGREDEPYTVLDGAACIPVTPGILAREAVLKSHQCKSNFSGLKRIRSLLLVNNIKHKTSIRAIELFSIIGFFWSAWQTAPVNLNIPLPFFDISAECFVAIIGVFCLMCVVIALGSPRRHLRWEAAAYRWTQNKAKEM